MNASVQLVLLNPNPWPELALILVDVGKVRFANLKFSTVTKESEREWATLGWSQGQWMPCCTFVWNLLWVYTGHHFWLTWKTRNATTVATLENDVRCRWCADLNSDTAVLDQLVFHMIVDRAVHQIVWLHSKVPMKLDWVKFEAAVCAQKGFALNLNQCDFEMLPFF